MALQRKSVREREQGRGREIANYTHLSNYPIIKSLSVSHLINIHWLQQPTNTNTKRKKKTRINTIPRISSRPTFQEEEMNLCLVSLRASQNAPAKPWAQMQWKEPWVFTQRPPFRQGAFSHSSTSLRQLRTGPTEEHE